MKAFVYFYINRTSILTYVCIYVNTLMKVYILLTFIEVENWKRRQ